MEISTYLSITLKVNELNAVIRHRVADGIKTNALPTRTHFGVKGTNKLTVRGWKKIFHANETTRKQGKQYSHQTK